MACENCPKENIVLISLIKNNERRFPIEVYITDAEYTYRDLDERGRRYHSYDKPYYSSGNDYEFYGVSKGRKQYNSNCYLHE